MKFKKYIINRIRCQMNYHYAMARLFERFYTLTKEGKASSETHQRNHKKSLEASSNSKPSNVVSMVGSSREDAITGGSTPTPSNL